MTLTNCLQRVRRCHPLLTRAGACTVCARRTLFLVEDPVQIRENARCVWCGSASRNRHVAKCVVETCSPSGVRSFPQLAATDSLTIFFMSAQGCFPAVLERRPHLTYSEYFDDVPSGESREGVLCQDVQQLSFSDSSFDLVVSEDVFEHVPDYRKGLREVYRVLKQGGHHIFSVPFGLSHPTRARYADAQGDSVPVLPQEYHGDPVRGSIAVYTSFGYDLMSILEGLGFEARLQTARYDECRRFGTFDSSTFITRKP